MQDSERGSVLAWLTAAQIFLVHRIIKARVERDANVSAGLGEPDDNIKIYLSDDEAERLMSGFRHAIELLSHEC